MADARLGELARLFLALGVTAFGGPAAHVALMEREVVQRRRWMTRAQFLDLLGAANLIPGPNSTELAIHVGHARAGWPGLLVAGACFILPAAGIVAALAWAYVRFGARPEAAALLYGVKPVVIAVVAQALWLLGRTALKTRGLVAVATVSAAAVAMGAHELAVLALAGLVMALVVWPRRESRVDSPPTAGAPSTGGTSRQDHGAALAWPLVAPAATVVAASAGAPFSLAALFTTFVKIGSVLFGSGYVLLAFLRADFVERLGWLTEAQLLDAVAIGQVTPGPVFTTATFIGYLLGGGAGASVATIGIFLPAFVFVAISAPVIPRLRRSRLVAAVLDGVNAASLALMAVVSVQLARAALVDLPTVLLALVTGVLLLRWKMNSAWLVLGGAVIGLLVH